MSIDFMKALKAPVSVEGWPLKTFIGGLIYLVPFLNFAAFGYFVEYFINMLKGNENLPGGPSDNLGKNFVTGAKLVVGYIIIGVILTILTIIIALLFSKIQAVAMLLTLVLEIVLGVAVIFLTMGFALDKKILSMVDFKRAMNIAKGNPDTLMFIVYAILIGIIYGLLMTVCAFLIIPIILIPFLAYTASISWYNLMGQYAQKSPYILAIKAKVQNNAQQQAQ